MHLWPSVAIRDSFKDSYLRNFEWNLNRMKQSQSHHQKLLSDQSTCEKQPKGFFGDALMLLSCFCCGGGEDDE